MSILSFEFFFGDIYSDTSGFDFYYQLPAIFSRNLNTLSLNKVSFYLSFLKVFFFKCTCKNEI